MYEKDEYGEYRRRERWIHAWGGGGSYVAGWCVCEVREYADGRTRVHEGEAQYLKDCPSPEAHALHAIYMAAAKGLGL